MWCGCIDKSYVGGVSNHEWKFELYIGAWEVIGWWHMNCIYRDVVGIGGFRFLLSLLTHLYSKGTDVIGNSSNCVSCLDSSIWISSISCCFVISHHCHQIHLCAIPHVHDITKMELGSQGLCWDFIKNCIVCLPVLWFLNRFICSHSSGCTFPISWCTIVTWFLCTLSTDSLVCWLMYFKVLYFSTTGSERVRTKGCLDSETSIPLFNGCAITKNEWHMTAHFADLAFSLWLRMTQAKFWSHLATNLALKLERIVGRLLSRNCTLNCSVNSNLCSTCYHAQLCHSSGTLSHWTSVLYCNFVD